MLDLESDINPGLSQPMTETESNAKHNNKKLFQELPMPSAKEFVAAKDGKFYCDHEYVTEKGEWYCGKVCPTGRDFRKHVRTHNPPVLCPVLDLYDEPCQVRTAEQRDMRRHALVNHPQWAWENQKEYGIEFEYLWKCECGTVFTREDNLDRHRKKYRKKCLDESSR
ncbi:hypothetical protein BKA67DRAFT_182342 [Truncatella angustata]|uniref:Uncharacterized protein n=1 Tax=Truncatella angustata TaxID=152316 RepID=A0A9P8US51_9PEZI|nr:uncharacterized protein BKA67DRAFT_182342 [Truncatella angustata]KAH6657196.1 hypothetical protein BKA67DRAFT_182342 [Truncatella angustata]